MIIITIAPAVIAIIVPTGPANGKKVVPGIIKEPQPIQQQKDNAQTCNGVKNFVKPAEEFFSFKFAINITPLKILALIIKQSDNLANLQTKFFSGIICAL